MSAVEDRLEKLREERNAREKARIEKLRELNLKKYNKGQNIPLNLPQKLVKSNSISQIKSYNKHYPNSNLKRPTTVPIQKTDVKTFQSDVNAVKPDVKTVKSDVKTNYLQKNIVAVKTDLKDTKVKDTNDKTIDKKVISNKINNDKLFDRKTVLKTDKILAEIKPFKKIDPKLTRKSMASPTKTNIPMARNSMITLDKKESVFDRLYKPKPNAKTTQNQVEKLQSDPNYLKKVIKNSGLILKRHSCFEPKQNNNPVRRSISAVHLKRIHKDEVNNCIHKWASIGDKLNKQHLPLDEVKEETICSAVKSERKKVKFMTPMSKLNTPRPEELQMRLKNWLQKRGKSLDSYQHLQCFGIHHLRPRPLELSTPKLQPYDEENKENIALDSDSDNGSYTDNMDNKAIDVDNWRQDASESTYTEFNDSADLNETLTSSDTFPNLEDLMIGALNDLTELLKEGFDWEQCGRYLRAIRTQFPSSASTAAYWECRAALEERRGDLHASVQCWEEAIAKGTERNVVEANLDTLLNKFMQLKISPNTTASKQPDPKMVDVKNVFKSTIIRFAVQQAKLRQCETPIFTVTPVRRSGRLSLCPTSRNKCNVGNKPNSNTFGNTPQKTLGNKGDSACNEAGLNENVKNCESDQSKPNSNKIGNARNIHGSFLICDSVKQVSMLVPKHVFTPNKNLIDTP